MGFSTIDERLEAQCGAVAVWQLLGDGRTRGAIRHATQSMRELHHGVYVSGHGRVTDEQRWIAAAVSAPKTVVDRWSGLAVHGVQDELEGAATTLVRSGSGGKEVFGRWGQGLVRPISVARAKSLTQDVVWVGAVPVLSPARCVLRVISGLDEERAARLVRDVIRLKAATAVDLRTVCARQRGDRGVAVLKALVDRYRPLSLDRTRSDAEALALELLHSAGVARPIVNGRFAGEESDLCWPDLMKIVELDGPSFHQFAEEDARKQRLWEAAGFSVSRLPTDDVYDHPHRLLDLAPAPTIAPNVEKWLL